jgi:hypothetical protein
MSHFTAKDRRRVCVRTIQANAVKVELVQHFAYEVLLVRSHRGVDRAHKLVVRACVMAVSEQNTPS